MIRGGKPKHLIKFCCCRSEVRRRPRALWPGPSSARPGLLAGTPARKHIRMHFTQAPGRRTSLGGTRSLLQYPGVFPFGPASWTEGGVGNQSLERQQQFGRTRDSVSTRHRSYYTHLGTPGHTPGSVPFPPTRILLFHYNDPECSSGCERCQAPNATPAYVFSLYSPCVPSPVTHLL